MSDDVDPTLAFLSDHARSRTDALTDLLVEAIERENPGYRTSNLVPRADLRASCHHNIARVLELLCGAVRDDGIGDPDEDSAFDASRETGRRRAEQGLPLDDVLRSFRIGGRMIWDDLVAHGAVKLDATALPTIGTHLWQVVDETSAQVAAAYHLAARDMVRADEQQRAELWEGLLGGRARDPGFAHEAAHLLDLPVHAELLVVVAPRLDLGRTDHHLSPHATAWTQRTGDVVGLVVLREDSPDEALAALAVAAKESGVPVGVSAVQPQLGAADDGYHQAALALRVQAGTIGVARFDQRLPEALLLASPEIADRLVERWLAPVLALQTAEQELLVETLESWVASGGSATQTALRVHCHRNTVVNRLRRVGTLTGQPLADDAVPVELDLALRSWRLGVTSSPS